MKTVRQCVGEFGRKRSRQEQLDYLGQILARFGHRDPRIGRIVARAANSRRLYGSYDEGGRQFHYGRPGREVINPLEYAAFAREPTDGYIVQTEALAAPILESLNHPDRLLVRMAFGIGRKRLRFNQIARKLGVTPSTVSRRLRSILATLRIRAAG